MDDLKSDRGGIHHITMIASDPQANVDFYAGVLGMRLTKRTVNFDDPSAYHLYYGDGVGSVGSSLTFFPYPDGRRATLGRGQVVEIQLAIPIGSTGFWRDRLARFGISFEEGIEFGSADETIFRDYDGLPLRLIEADIGTFAEWPEMVVDSSHAIRRSVGVTIAARYGLAGNPTMEILTRFLGFTGESHMTAKDGSWVRLIDGGAWPAGNGGAGGVHHVAFRAADDETQLGIHDELHEAGLQISHVYERDYFRSVYFREPGGVLFEVATDGPGFLIDESYEELGASLRLPAMYEPYRARIESSLPALRFDPAKWRQ